MRVRLDDGSIVDMTLEEHKAMLAAKRAVKEKEAQDRLDALAHCAGIYRLILTGPNGAQQIFATNQADADEIIRRKLPTFLDTEVPKAVDHVPVKRGPTNSHAIRVVAVEDSGCIVQPGDVFTSTAELGRLLQIKYFAQRVTQARADNSKTVTVRGVTFCKESDYDSVLDAKYGKAD